MSHDQLLEMSQRVSVRPATSIDDLHRIAALRYTGYRCFDSVTSALDDLDFAASCPLLVAETPQRGIVGTVRLLEGRGEIELGFCGMGGMVPRWPKDSRLWPCGPSLQRQAARLAAVPAFDQRLATARSAPRPNALQSPHDLAI